MTMICQVFRNSGFRKEKNQRPNRTLTCPPWGTREPAGGDCDSATPLPVTSNSIPAACASSKQVRNGLPRKSGTITPPLTSSTMVPRAGVGAVAGGRTGSGCRTGAGAGVYVAETSLASACGSAGVTPGDSADAGSASLAMRSVEPSAMSASLACARSIKRFGSRNSTSCGTPRYPSTCCATRVNTGAATAPPSCAPTGASRTTNTVMAGLFTGAKPTKEATCSLWE